MLLAPDAPRRRRHIWTLTLIPRRHALIARFWIELLASSLSQVNSARRLPLNTAVPFHPPSNLPLQERFEARSIFPPPIPPGTQHVP